MRAVARRSGANYRHHISIRSHNLFADEPLDAGGEDSAPSPEELLAASLAACTAITMEMYASRKGWPVDDIEVDCDYSPAERGCPTRFELVLRLPEELSDDQVERLTTIAARCPIHRTLEGEVMFSERIERKVAAKGAR